MEKHPENCKEVFALLSEYLDLELPPDACQEIEQHLAGCPPCIEFANSLRKTVEICRQYEPAEMPEPIEEGAREQLLAAYRKMLAAKTGPGAGGRGPRSAVTPVTRAGPPTCSYPEVWWPARSSSAGKPLTARNFCAGSSSGPSCS